MCFSITKIKTSTLEQLNKTVPTPKAVFTFKGPESGYQFPGKCSEKDDQDDSKYQKLALCRETTFSSFAFPRKKKSEGEYD